MIERLTTWSPVIIGCLALAGGVLLGRGTVQPETREVERVVYRDRVVEVVKTVQAEAKRVVVYRDRVTKPDGTKVEREVERTETDTRTTTDRTAERTNEGKRDVERVVTVRPDWRVGVLAGASLREPLLPVYGPVVVGGYVERRIVGPFSAGVWGLSSGAAGLSLSVEF